VVPETPPADERLTRSYDDLVKRDRELQARQERLRSQEADLRSFRQLREQASTNPGEALRALGIDPFTLSDRLLGIEPVTPKAEPPKDVLTRQEAQELFSQQLQHQQQVWQHQQSIAQMIHASDHELLRDMAVRNPAVVGEIYNEAVRRFQDSNALPDIPAMIAEREQREEAALYASIDKVLQFGKVKARYKLSGGNETPTAPPQKTPTAPPQKTLSQQQKEEPSHEERPMTDEERWREFARALKEGPPKGWKSDL
jgi:hypothetical protein